MRPRGVGVKPLGLGIGARSEIKPILSSTSTKDSSASVLNVHPEHT